MALSDWSIQRIETIIIIQKIKVKTSGCANAKHLITYSWSWRHSDSAVFKLFSTHWIWPSKLVDVEKGIWSPKTCSHTHNCLIATGPLLLNVTKSWLFTLGQMCNPSLAWTNVEIFKINDDDELMMISKTKISFILSISLFQTIIIFYFENVAFFHSKLGLDFYPRVDNQISGDTSQYLTRPLSGKNAISQLSTHEYWSKSYGVRMPFHTKQFRIREETLESGNLFSGSWIFASGSERHNVQ